MAVLRALISANDDLLERRLALEKIYARSGPANGGAILLHGDMVEIHIRRALFRQNSDITRGQETTGSETSCLTIARDN
jgi:hypothetical protein